MSASNADDSSKPIPDPIVVPESSGDVTAVAEPSTTTAEPSQVTSTDPPVKEESAVGAAPEAAAEEPSSVANDGSTTEQALPSSPSSATKGEQAVRISLLLSTGNRHPFTINNKFLQRHSIQATDSDPWNIKVYDMKTLIWHEWLGEWETRPTSPALIRLIFLGGLLDDKSALKDCRLSKTEPNVVHMTVKPQDLLEDDEVKGKEPKQGSTRQRRSGGCCVIL